jgi:Tfp pilus assembly protein FimT
MYPQRISGYTLIELITTLTVAIFLSLSAVAMEPLVAASKATSAMQSLIRTSQLAKSSAITRSMRISLCATVDSTHCEEGGENLSLIIFIDSNQNFQRDNDETILARTPIKGLLSWNGAHNIARYRPDGTIIEFGTFTYCPLNRDNRYAHQLTANSAGRSYLSRDRDGDGRDDKNTANGPIDCTSI